MKFKDSPVTPPEPWQRASSLYQHRLTAEQSARVQDDQSSNEGALTRDLQEQQIQWVLQQIESLGSTNSGKVLDLGCGNGHHLNILAQMGWTGWGVDQNPRSIHRLRRSPGGKNGQITGTCADLAQLGEDIIPIPGSIDLCLLTYGTACTLEPKTLRDALSFTETSLRPGGLLVLDVLTDEYPAFFSRSEQDIQLVHEETYTSEWFGFWGILPKQIFERIWYYPNQALHCEEYRTKNDIQILTWKKTYDPSEFCRSYSTPGLQCVGQWEGSLGVDLPDEEGFLDKRKPPWYTLVFRREPGSSKL
jgi:SAM-dependent methyltransferase